ncbi:MAG: V-type ATP synthase subunit I, partial [Candidatus Hydrogenedentota bacterium]
EQLLIWAIYIGIFHVLLGLVLGIKESFRHGHKMHGLEKLGMFLGLIALLIQSFANFDVAPFNSSIFTVLSVIFFAVGVVLIFYTMKFMGFIGLIEIMSLGGNIISYARLMALGVASYVIADIANTLPGMMGYWIGIPMAIVVHTGNIALGIASPTIHSLRLNFVEFLPKFYSPEGKGFTPFKKEIVS